MDALNKLCHGLPIHDIGKSREKTTTAKAEKRIQSIAVLPLKNTSGKTDQEYFADGMTEELTASKVADETPAVHIKRSILQPKEIIQSHGGNMISG
jgi:hypothetical protein